MGTMDVVQRQHLRTVVLIILREIYPKAVSIPVLQDSLNGRGLEVGTIPLFAEVIYLEEKHLVRVESPVTWKKATVRIAARGIDYLEGSIQEVGLASPDLYQ